MFFRNYVIYFLLIVSTQQISAEQYQDIFINGTVTSQGSRECAPRYEALVPLLKKYKRPFTVLDLGASQGYFSFRIAHDFPAVAVMIEGNYTKYNTANELLELCKQNTQLNSVIYLQKQITPEDLEHLAECEHFDVVLAFNIIHHFSKQWKRVADAIFRLGDHIIVETPPSTDAVFAHNKEVKDLETYLKNKKGTVIAKTPRHTDPSALALMTHFEVHKTAINYKHWFFGTPTFGSSISYSIVSSFNEKSFIKIKPESTIKRPWYPGINFITFKALNGVWPTKKMIIEDLLSFTRLNHPDLLPWNIIIQGKKLQPIDNDGEFYADPAKCLLYTLNFAQLKTYEDLKNYFLNELHPNQWKFISETEMALFDQRALCVDTAIGELVDKITILQLKEKHTNDESKLKNIKHELNALQKILDSQVQQNDTFKKLTADLYQVNQALWDIEDTIRVKEKNKQFDEEFVELARSIYFMNDKRAKIKREINVLCNSEIVEEKIYEQY